jgi:hypothetical protein
MQYQITLSQEDLHGRFSEAAGLARVAKLGADQDVEARCLSLPSGRWHLHIWTGLFPPINPWIYITGHAHFLDELQVKW